MNMNVARTHLAPFSAFVAACALTAFAARADAQPNEGDRPARWRVGVGVGVAVPINVGASSSYPSGVSLGVWGAIPLSARLQLTPSIALYRIGRAYGSDDSWRTDLALALEYVVPLGSVRFVPGVSVSVAQAGVVVGKVRGFGVGVSLELRVPVTGPLEVFARSDHRMVLTVEEGIVVNQFVLGPAFRF